MIIQNKEKGNKKYYEEIMYISSNYTYLKKDLKQRCIHYLKYLSFILYFF